MTSVGIIIVWYYMVSKKVISALSTVSTFFIFHSFVILFPSYRPLNSTPFQLKPNPSKLVDVVQGDEPEAPKKKKGKKGKKNKNKKGRSRKGGKKESRKKRKEAEALEEGFLEVSNHQLEYLNRDVTPAVTEPTPAVTTPNTTTEQTDSIPEMPTHESDSLPTTSPEDVTVSPSALPQSTQAEVEVDCKCCPSCPSSFSSSSPTDHNTS